MSPRPRVPRTAEPAGAAGDVGRTSVRSRLTSILGEFAYVDQSAVWTSTLVDLLVRAGADTQAARQAIARTAAAGWLTGERVGRRTRWRLTDAGNAVMAEGRDRVLAMGGPQPPWDGSWLIVQVTVPTASRAVRPTLYGALRWYGFGNPTPGLWLSPHRQHVDAVGRLVHRLDLAGTTLSFVGVSAAIGLSDAELVTRSWDLDELRAYYAGLLGRFGRRRLRGDDEILLDHLDLITAWQRIPFVDPQLPEELLPNWIGRRTVVRFAELRDDSYDRAAARWRELVADAD